MVQGPLVKAFEGKWSEYTGARHSIAVTSCTTGLYLSLVALGFESMPDSARRYLRDFFATDIEQLKNIVDFSTDDWI